MLTSPGWRPNQGSHPLLASTPEITSTMPTIFSYVPNEFGIMLAATPDQYCSD